MDWFKYITAGSIVALLGVAVFAMANVASAQVSTNYWKLSASTLSPNIASWTLTLPYLAGVGTRAVCANTNGLLTITGCSSGGGSGLATSSLVGTWPIIITPGSASVVFSFGGLSTTSPWTAGQLAEVSNGNTVFGVATGTVTNGAGISVTAGQSIVGSGLTITNTGVTSITANSPLTRDTATGAVTVSCASCLTAMAFSYPFPLLGLATSSPIMFLASTTIGAGGQTTGLTVSGGSTTTLTAYFAQNAGIGSTTPGALLAISPVAGSAAPFIIGSSTPSQPTFQVTPGRQTATCLDKYGNAPLPATSTTMTVDWINSCPEVDINIGTAGVTISLINATTSNMSGSKKLLNICNSGSTASTVTWKGVQWYGGTSPTQTTTANKCDTYSFHVTSGTSTLLAPSYIVAGAQTAGL